MANQRARQFRKLPTVIEDRLWYHLRRRQLGGHRFRRQHPIGPYIVDFVCLERHLVVEVDGGQHAEQQRGHDLARDAWLCRHGYRVLRFWNVDVVENTEGVLDSLLDALGGPLPEPA
jgi:very-short-patch-repair endonuclease